MTLCPRGHSYDVPRVVYDLTNRSIYSMRSLYKQNEFSVIVIFVVNCYCLFYGSRVSLITVCCDM